MCIIMVMSETVKNNSFESYNNQESIEEYIYLYLITKNK